MTLKTNQDNVVKYVVADLVPFQRLIENRISLKSIRHWQIHEPNISPRHKIQNNRYNNNINNLRNIIFGKLNSIEELAWKHKN
jgi:hypothetical protein